MTTRWVFEDLEARLLSEDGDLIARFRLVLVETPTPAGGWVLVGSDTIRDWTERAIELGAIDSLDRVRHVERCELCLGRVTFGRDGYTHVDDGSPASALRVGDDIEVVDEDGD